MKTKTSFDGNVERYTFDLGECSTKNGWAQFDTSQDASYFGIWVNPFNLSVFTLCEGDMTLEEAESEEEFSAHLGTMRDFYNNGTRFLGIDPGFNGDLKQRFVDLSLGYLLH